MSYEIHGAGGAYKATRPNAASALVEAKAAEPQFGPLEIRGPGGRMTLDQLAARADAERADANRT